MGRATTALGMENVHPGGLDRSVGGANYHQPASTGDPPRGAAGTGTVLSGTTPGHAHAPPLQDAFAAQGVVPHDIWFRLSPSERRCFGHRFSGMVLKAVRPRPAKEVSS